jgi:hypothetical protein
MIDSSEELHWCHSDVWGTRKNLSKCWVCYGRRWNIMYAPVLESRTKHMDPPPKNYCMEYDKEAVHRQFCGH